MDSKTYLPELIAGEKVIIANYGHLMWESKSQIYFSKDKPIVYETEGFVFFDADPTLIGVKATVEEVKEVQGVKQYSLAGVSKHAWYDREQLHKINDRPMCKEAKDFDENMKKLERRLFLGDKSE